MTPPQQLSALSLQARRCREAMIRSTSMESLPPGGSVRLDFSFLFVGLHFPPHCDFGKSKKKKKKNTGRTLFQMLCA